MKHFGKKQSKKNKQKNKNAPGEHIQLHAHNNKWKRKHQKGISHNIINALEKSGGALSANLSTGSIDAEVWCKWTVLNGTRLDPVWLFARLKEIIRFMFLPVNMRREGPNVVFYMYMTRRTIEDARNDLRAFLDPLEGKEILVNIIQVPDVGPLDLTEDVVKGRIREALDKRFQRIASPTMDGSSAPGCWNFMDLSAFHQDAFLLGHQIVATLSQNSVAGFIVDTLCQTLPELHALDLSDNKLVGLGAFKNLFLKFPMLMRLNLSQNALRQLEKEIVQPLVNIQELNLVNTPFNSRGLRENGAETFQKNLLKQFPNLRVLNSELIARKEPESDVVKYIPTAEIAYFVQPNLANDVKRFILNYLTLLDTNRKGLMEYYSDASILTFHCVHHDLMGNLHKQKNLRLSQNLLNQSRNLLRCKDIAHRRDTVKRGPLQIVGFLDTFPRTEHIIRDDHSTFRVDVPLCTPTFMELHFQGVYLEMEESVTLLRQFTRTMIIVQPQTVLTDDWFVTTAAGTVRKLFSDDHPRPAITPDLSVTTPLTSHDDLISQLSALTKMNRPFAEKCLIDSQWDLERALTTFRSLHESNSIPDIAFVH